MDGKELKEENITKTEGKKKGKLVIIVLTIVILLLAGCVCFLLFKMNENKTNKKENTKEIEKGEINEIEIEKGEINEIEKERKSIKSIKVISYW